MKRLALALLAFTLCVAGASAQVVPPGTNPVPGAGAYNSSPPTCQSGQYCALQTDVNGQLKIAGTIAATLAGFTPGGTFATLTATATSASVALPAGSTVAIQNTGTTAVSCTLGIGSATALVSEIIIQPASTVFVTPGSNTFGACIDQTGSASNLIVLAGGSGLGAGFGGGGSGGGGGGGAITAAIGSYVAGALSAGAFATGAGVDGWDLTQGAKADAAWASGSGSVISLLKAIAAAEIVTNRAVNVAQWGGNAITCTVTAYGTAPTGNCPGFNVFVTNTNANGQAIAANSSPVVLPTAQVTADPCTLGTKTNFTIATSSGTVQLVAPSGSTQVYICSLFTIGATASIQNIVGGTGASCTTGTPIAIAGSTTAASGMSFAVNGGFTFGNGGGTILRTTTAGHGVCLIQSATAAIAGGGTFVQQ